MSISSDTKHKLLDAACDIFAEKGYRNATIKDICGRAEANIASVNYYFGSKKVLFEFVWRQVYEIINEKYPLEEGVGPNPTPQERLRCHIYALMRRIFDEGRVGLLHAMTFSAGSHDVETMAIIKELFRSHRDYMAGNVRAILGSAVPDMYVKLCSMSIVSQCFSLYRWPLPDGKKFRDIFDMGPEVMAGHIYRFSLAGLESTRKMFEKQ
ncbi:MAG TPA: TetR/AcrR family transcriptional regulator [Phycisphaerae bacterium]|nr:TetR/AcrR family transcriptional regulator [Phycisphaerae bacterium]